MPLFPAYVQDEPTTTLASNDEPWLRNDSFIGFDRLEKVSLVRCHSGEADASASSSCSSSSEDGSRHLDHRVNKRRHSPSHRPPYKRRRQGSLESEVKDVEVLLSGLGFIDVKPSSSRAQALLNKTKTDKKMKSKKKIMKQFLKERYFFKMSKIGERSVGEEDDVAERMRQFNSRLAENPTDIDTWMEYIQFQECVTGGEGRAVGEMKLSVLESALAANPGSPRLLDLMFSTLHAFSTPHQIRVEAKKLLTKDKRNLVAWQWMIKSYMLDMAGSTTSHVLDTFAQALQALFATSPNDSTSLLDVLLECCVFLRQSGLWEQLWMTLRLSLQLNLSTPDSDEFRKLTDMDPLEIRKREDEIIMSGLPLSSLWSRMEYLRSCVHFLPVTECRDDPQRVVFPCDAAPLVHPVHSDYIHRLLAVLLTAVKVPLMPASHCAAEFVGTHRLPWAIESPEYLLASLTHPYLIKHRDKSCLKVCRELLVSPQCLATDRAGAVELFSATDSQFHSILSSLEGNAGNSSLSYSIAVWNMRWYRLLTNRRKEAMTLLKREGQRENVALFTEFALLCEAEGERETCSRVMERCLRSTSATAPLLHLPAPAHLAHLYRNYVEILLRTPTATDNRNKVFKLLHRMVLGESTREERVSCSEILRVKERLEAVSKEMVRGVAEGGGRWEGAVGVRLEDLVVPPVEVSWLVCHAWFLYLHDCPTASARLLHSASAQIAASSSLTSSSQLTLAKVVVEGWDEAAVAVLDEACAASLPDHYSQLRRALLRSLHLFPNNLYLLHMASSTEVMGSGRWRGPPPIKSGSTGVLVTLFTVLLNRQRMFLSPQSVSEDERAASERKVYDVVRRRMEEAGGEGERCPLLWRLALQLVAAQHPTRVKSTLYRALDRCPWVKSIYYDGAVVLPEETTRIQDLLVEKELRIHITSEELQILRQQDAHLPLPTSNSPPSHRILQTEEETH